MRTLSLVFATTLAAALVGCDTNKPKVDKDRQIEIHTESAAGYMGMGEYERAIDQAMRGLELDPNNFTLRLYLGRALLKRGGTKDVLQAEDLLRQLPVEEDFRVTLSLAEALERKGVAYDEAARGVATGEVFTQADDPIVRAEQLREQALVAWNESYTQYGIANDLQPNDPEIVSGMVRITSLLGRNEESLQWADAILVSSATDRSVFQGLLERPEVSVSEEERLRSNITRITDLEIAVLMQAASTAVALERPEAAVEYLERAIEIDPDIAQAHSRRAQLLIDLGEFEDALAGIDAFLRLTDLEFDHPYVRKAFELRRACELALEAPPLSVGTDDG